VSTLPPQYFGSVEGYFRQYPGTEWGRNPSGLHGDFDPRFRPWYVSATSGPKDLYVIIDCSATMTGDRTSAAVGVLRNLVDTLTKKDHVYVVCARGGYYEYDSTYHYYSPYTLGCDRISPATVSVKKEIMERATSIGGTGRSNLDGGFAKAFGVAAARRNIACQQIFVLITPGQNDYPDDMHCGPGRWGGVFGKRG
jgi:voltage-dependent calcium channel alpha-2/delta-3